MTKQTQSILLNVLLLTIIFIIILLIILDNYSLFKEKIKNNKLDKTYKNDMNMSIKEYKDNRPIEYRLINSKKSINLTIDASNPSLNNDYKPLYIKRYDLKVKNKKRNKILKIIFDIIFSIIFIFIFSFTVYSKLSNNLYEINNKTYVTINSGSMSYKNEENSYLKDMNLNDQIKTYSLISLEKVNNNDNIKLFDIYAYKNNKNNLIVHRVIAKLEVNNEIYYTFRGDANSSSDYYLVKSSDILYHYTGYNNYPLGIIFSFSGSYVGLVSITYTLLSLIILDIFDNKKVKLYESQFNSVKDRINQEEINKLPKVKVIELK